MSRMGLSDSVLVGSTVEQSQWYSHLLCKRVEGLTNRQTHRLLIPLHSHIRKLTIFFLQGKNGNR
jgi:hypothetical protein